MINLAIKTGLKFCIRQFMSASSGKPQLAFLGPLGTYSHQAAFECFGDSVEYLGQPTIAGVQKALSADIQFGIIPQENSTNGSVIETYDVLRVPAVGQQTFVRGVTVIAVKHNLVARRGVKLENIEKVLSHEQALGQCQKWLSRHLPQASLVYTDSTASAAKKLLSAENGLDPTKCAAICSSVVVTIYGGLEILEEGIQDGPGNFTRFYILSHGLDVTIPGNCTPSEQSMALLRLQVPPGDTADQTVPNISKVITALDLIVSRIDRRPSLHAKPFDDVYFLEVSAIGGRNSTERSWAAQLKQAVDKAKSTGMEVAVLGCW